MTEISQATLFLDANILISAAWKENAEIQRIWQLEGVRLVTSIYVMAEVQRNLPQISQIERLRQYMTHVDVLVLPELPTEHAATAEILLLPEKDRPVLAAAVQARADYLITGDKKHFQAFFGKVITGVRVEPPSNLLTIFQLRSL